MTTPSKLWLARNSLLLVAILGVVVWNQLDLRGQRTREIQSACEAANVAIEANRKAWVVLQEASAENEDRTEFEKARAEAFFRDVFATLEPADC